MNQELSRFRELTWDTLGEWAGETIVGRGKSYRRRVKDLRRSDDGVLVAWVEGTETYATRVRLDADGEPGAACSCPYPGGPCKHAVAVILVCIDALKEKRKVKPVDPGDPRLGRLESLSEDDAPGEYDDEDFDEEDDETESASDDSNLSGGTLDEQEGARSPGERRRGRRGGRASVASSPQRDAAAIREHFESLSRKDLIEFAVRQAAAFPEVGRAIVEGAQLRGGQVDAVVRAVRKEITKVSREPSWWNHWSGEGRLADYSHVLSQLKVLLEAGHAEEVVTRGEYLWKRGLAQIEQSDDEGEAAAQIGECMNVILRAVETGSMTPSERMLFQIEKALEDDYGILGEGWCTFDAKAYDRAAWADVAETLTDRLNAMPKPKETDEFFARYGRERLLRCVIDAYECAGRTEDIIVLLEREVEATRCYESLIDYLVKARRRKEARDWAVRGFNATAEDSPGIAWKLEATLRELATRKKDRPMVAAYRAFEFFDRPSLQGYQKLRKDAQAAGVWDAVRSAVLAYLETGTRPDGVPRASRKGKTGPQITAWPLPGVELAPPRKKWEYTENEFPNVEILIRIAIDEKRNDDALRWYETGGTGWRWPVCSKEVANAVQETHPDEAMEIWKAMAEERIGVVNTAAYKEAAKWLKRIRALSAKHDAGFTWRNYLNELRGRHKAKRSLMKILDTIQSQPIKPKRIVDE